jgi:hypothetical protein
MLTPANHALQRTWPSRSGCNRRVVEILCLPPSISKRGAALDPPLTRRNASIRAEYGYPPKIDDFFGDVSPVEAGDWTYELWLEGRPFHMIEKIRLRNRF